MYAVTNFKTKKALKEAVKAWTDWQNDHPNGLPSTQGLLDSMTGATAPQPVRIFAPGLGHPKVNGTEYLEGPHYPEPHRWYAQVTMRDGVVVAVK